MPRPKRDHRQFSEFVNGLCLSGIWHDRLEIPQVLILTNHKDSGYILVYSSTLTTIGVNLVSTLF